MEYVRLGKTGLKISRIALGCMSCGDPTSTGAHLWSLDDEDAQPFFRQAVELGVTSWDTANVYQHGTSEELVGRAIKRYARREEIVLATKVHGKMHDGPGGQGLSRKAILEQVDASLARLGTDDIDLYQIHRFDPDARVEETMEALHDIVKAGKVRYLGASSMHAWQFAKLQHAADRHGWTRFVSMQNQDNLLRRPDERELLAMCADMGVGVVPTPRRARAAWLVAGASSPTAPAWTRSSRLSTHRWTSRSSTRSSASPKPAGPAWPRSPWPGCCSTPSSPPPSSERPSPITCRRRSQPWPCTSPTTKSMHWKRRTHPTAPPGTNQPTPHRPSAGTAEHHHQQPPGPLRWDLQLPQGVGVTSR